MNTRIQVMIDSRQLEVLPAADAEVRGMWIKAARSLQSSAVAGLDADAAFTLGYQAALQAATAVIRAAGYRVYGDGHHHHTFAAVAAFNLGGLSDAAREMNIIRQKRHRAVYDWEGRTGDEDLSAIRAAVNRLFREGRQWLERERPTLELPAPADPE